MDCDIAQKNMNSFLKGTLKGDELRRTYYHISDCKKDCKEVLLDEFSFYTAFNDLDNDLDFNYRKKLDELMSNTKKKIESYDLMKTVKYYVLSILICVAFIGILILAIKLKYG